MLKTVRQGKAPKASATPERFSWSPGKDGY